MNRAAVFACSHRAGGNTDAAARLVAEALASKAGAVCETLAVRDYAVRHCQACNACLDTPGHACVLAGTDDAEQLFAPFLTAPAVVLASPIYFYHLPSMLKTLIDRGQRFWAARERGAEEIVNLPVRPAWVVLAAARPRGERLFEGALLTLKRFLFYFNIELQAPVVLRGLDGPSDLENDRVARDEVLALADRAAGRLAAGP